MSLPLPTGTAALKAEDLAALIGAIEQRLADLDRAINEQWHRSKPRCKGLIHQGPIQGPLGERICGKSTEPGHWYCDEHAL